MKPLLAILAALGIAVAMLPLREWTELDLLRAPVNRWLWIRSVATAPRQQIDYAFTGSSITLAAIRPERLSDRYPGTVSYNFAHFSWGHDADYFVAKALLERHDVGTLVVELPRTAPRSAHAETVNLVGASELVGETRIAITEYAAGAGFRDVSSRVFRYVATSLLSFPRHVLERVAAAGTGRDWEYRSSLGSWGEHNGFSQPLEHREPQDGFRERQVADPPRLPVHPAWPRIDGEPEPSPGPREDWYLTKLRDLAAEHDTRLVFLHVPRWRKRLPSAAQHRYYRRFGEVLIPDLGKLQVPEYYVDPLHLYREGTQVLTDDVARLLVEGTDGSPYNDLYERGEAGTQ